MTDVLAGMSRKEAEALVAACDGLSDNGGSRDKLLALAALGARCVGAKEMFAPLKLVHPDSRFITDNGAPALRVLVLEGE